MWAILPSDPDQDKQHFDVPRQLGLSALNSGTCYGADLWSVVRDHAVIDSINPTTQKSVGKVAASSAMDMEQVVIAAQKGFVQWRCVPAPKRGECIRRIADELRINKDALASLISLEMGKIKQESLGEVQEMIDIAEFAVGQSRMLYGNTMHSERPEHRLYEQWHPLGPIGVITAFNFPMAVWSWNAFIAAVCGNTIIWKPSPKAPLCAIAAQHICNRVMQAMGVDGVFNLCIPNENSLIDKLVDDNRLPLISFTGSSSVGRGIAARLGQRFGRSLLELSGNNAIIVDASANLKLAIPAILFGFVGTTGQRCTSTRRLFIHESRFDELIEKLMVGLTQVRIGNPLTEQTLMGPLIDQAAVAEFERNIVEIKSLGGTLLSGGKVIPGNGYYVEPTMVLAENHWPVVQRETFAPILYIMRFSQLDEAIKLQNAVPQGLSSAIFTESLRHAEIFLSARGSDCGIANVNIGTSGAEIGGAFGGEKETGGGREAGSDSWKVYMRRQTNTINWGTELPLAQGIRFKI